MNINKASKRLPIGVSDFRELVLDNYFFIDKTLLIKEFIESSPKVTLITRPRRFGKTLNLSMLGYFLQLESQYQLQSQVYEAGVHSVSYESGDHSASVEHGCLADLFKDLKISAESIICQQH